VQAITGNIPSVTDFQFIHHFPGEFSGFNWCGWNPAPGAVTNFGCNVPSAGCRSSVTRLTATSRATGRFGNQPDKKRLFLHSLETSFRYDWSGRTYELQGDRAAAARNFRRWK